MIRVKAHITIRLKLCRAADGGRVVSYIFLGLFLARPSRSDISTQIKLFQTKMEDSQAYLTINFKQSDMGYKCRVRYYK